MTQSTAALGPSRSGSFRRNGIQTDPVDSVNRRAGSKGSGRLDPFDTVWIPFDAMGKSGEKAAMWKPVLGSQPYFHLEENN